MENATEHTVERLARHLYEEACRLRDVAGRSEEGRRWAIVATDAEKALAYVRDVLRPRT